MSYSWFRQGTCTVGASDVVRFQSANITTAPNKPVVGDAFTVGGFRFYEIIFIGSDATGEYIRLNRAYEEAAGSNISYAVARFASGTQNAKLVAMASAAINQKQISLDDMYEWYTSQADTVQFLGPDGTLTTLTTYFKLSQEITAVGGNAGAITIVANEIISVKNVSDNMADVKDAKSQADRAKTEADRAAAAAASNYAMSQAQFEAIRAQNNEEFDASGFVHLGKQISTGLATLTPINEGLTSITESGNTNLLLFGRYISATNTVGKSKTDYPIVNIAGFITHIEKLGLSSTSTPSIIKLPQAPDGKTTYNNSTGVVTNHATVTAAFNAQAANPTNIEVVTDRKNMWGFEFRLEEITATNPRVYPNGLPQSQATSMDGIATSSSNRPVDFYAVFTGDTTSKGKSVDFFAATDAQKKNLLANPKNILYYNADGKLMQGQLFQDTKAGFGNGDWNNIEVVKGAMQFKSGLPFTSRKGGQWIASKEYTGLFEDGLGSYYLVCGTVSRLNQGAYHQSYNPLGSAKFVGDTFWYNTAASVTSKADCFDPAKLLAGSGAIASGKSGRPDGRFYDAIYADGQGGVCRDMRYSANGVDSVDFADGDQKVKNGAYRGFEEVPLCGTEVTLTTIGDGINNYVNFGTVKFKSGKYINLAPFNTKCLDGLNNLLVDKATGNIYKAAAWSNEFHLRLYKWDGSSWLSANLTAATVNAMTFAYYPYSSLYTGLPSTNIMWSGINSSSQAGYVFTGKVYAEEIPSSVGGNFLVTEVIATNAVINATAALSDGWSGFKNAKSPTGSVSVFELSRDAVSTPTALRSTNNGASWSAFTPTFNAANNSVTLTNEPATNIVILQYQAFAKQTESAPNAAIYGLIPYNVFASSDYRTENGALLGESLIGKVLKNNSGVSVNNKSLLSCAIDSAGKLTSAANFDGITHQALTLGSPANNSPAFKMVSYLANISQQAIPHFAYTELRHNGTSFGDDGKQTIVDNQSTKPNDHGVTVSVGTARLREPLGWFKNKV